MNAAYKTRPLVHLLAMQACVARWGFEARMDMRTFGLSVDGPRGEQRFFPQVTRFVKGELMYSRRIDEGVRGFIGWLPYAGKRWPAGALKGPFKRFCLDQGLRTPAFSLSSPAGMAEFIVKRDNSSFGRGLQGPFRAGEGAQGIPVDGYYEEFIRGRILKAWYWDDALLCLETSAFPTVIGDGKARLRDLVAADLLPYGIHPDWETHACMAKLMHRRSLEDVPSDGEIVAVDYRYGSTIVARQTDNTNQLGALAGSAVVRELTALGPTLLRTIPEDKRGAGTLYSIDAIAGDDDRVWLLEMNCNPMVHPDAYPSIFTSLFGEPIVRVASASLPVALPPVGAYRPLPAGAPARYFRFA